MGVGGGGGCSGEAVSAPAVQDASWLSYSCRTVTLRGRGWGLGGGGGGGGGGTTVVVGGGGV